MRPGRKESPSNAQRTAGSNINSEDKLGGQNNLDVHNRPIMCKFRKKDGHVIKNCPDPRCKDAKVPTFTKPMASININEARKGQDNILQAFRSTGTVSLNSNTKKYNIVRDTASAKTVTAREAFPAVDSTIPFNLAEEYLESNLAKG